MEKINQTGQKMGSARDRKAAILRRRSLEQTSEEGRGEGRSVIQGKSTVEGRRSTKVLKLTFIISKCFSILYECLTFSRNVTLFFKFFSASLGHLLFYIGIYIEIL